MTTTRTDPSHQLSTVLGAAGAIVLACSLASCAPTTTPDENEAHSTSEEQTSSPTETDDATQEDDMEQAPLSTGNVLPEEMSGQEAIDALGDKIEIVAKRNSKSVEDLKALLLRSPSAHVTPQGHIVYRDGFGSTPSE